MTHSLNICILLRLLPGLLDPVLRGPHHASRVPDLQHPARSHQHRHVAGLRQQRAQPHHLHHLQHRVQEVLQEVFPPLLLTSDSCWWGNLRLQLIYHQLKYCERSIYWWYLSFLGPFCLGMFSPDLPLGLQPEPNSDAAAENCRKRQEKTDWGQFQMELESANFSEWHGVCAQPERINSRTK